MRLPRSDKQRHISWLFSPYNHSDSDHFGEIQHPWEHYLSIHQSDYHILLPHGHHLEIHLLMTT